MSLPEVVGMGLAAIPGLVLGWWLAEWGKRWWRKRKESR